MQLPAPFLLRPQFLLERLKLVHLLVVVVAVAILGTIGSVVGQRNPQWIVLDPVSFGNVGQWVSGIAAAAAILALGIERRERADGASQQELSELQTALFDWTPHHVGELPEQRTAVSSALAKRFPQLQPDAQWLAATKPSSIEWGASWHYGPQPWDALKVDLLSLVSKPEEVDAVVARIARFRNGYEPWAYTWPLVDRVLKGTFREPNNNRLMAKPTSDRTRATRTVKQLEAQLAKTKTDGKDTDQLQVNLKDAQNHLAELVAEDYERRQEKKADAKARALPGLKDGVDEVSSALRALLRWSKHE